MGKKDDDQTLSDKITEGAEEYGRNLLDRLLGGVFDFILKPLLFVGALFGGAALLSHNFEGVNGFLNNLIGPNSGIGKWIGETFGAKGQAMVGQLFGITYPGANQEAFENEMTPEEAVDTIKGVVRDYNSANERDIVVGDRTLKALVGDPANRKTTLALLKKADPSFNLDDPKFTPELIRKALTIAINDPGNYSLYTGALLKGVLQDIRDINAGTQTAERKLLDVNRLLGMFNDDKALKGGTPLLFNRDLIKSVLAQHGEYKDEINQIITSMLPDDMSKAVFSANAEGLHSLIDALGADQASGYLTRIMGMMGKDNFSVMTILNDSTMMAALRKDKDPFIDFLKEMDLDVDTSGLNAIQRNQLSAMQTAQKLLSNDLTTRLLVKNEGHIRDLATTLGTDALPAVETLMDAVGSGGLSIAGLIKNPALFSLLKKHEAALTTFLNDMDLDVDTSSLSATQQRILSGLQSTQQLLQNDQILQFLRDNSTQLQTLAKSIGSDETISPLVETIAAAIGQEDFTPATLLQNKTFQQTLKTHEVALTAFLRDMNVEALPDTPISADANAPTIEQQFVMARQLLLAPSDERNRSNLQILIAASTNPTIYNDISNAITAFSSPAADGKTTSAVDTLTLSAESAETIQKLNFDYDEVVDLAVTAAEKEATQRTRGLLDTDTAIQLQNSLPAWIGGGKSNLPTTTEMQNWKDNLPSLEGVSEGKDTAALEEGDVDQLIQEQFVKPAVERTTQTR